MYNQGYNQGYGNQGQQQVNTGFNIVPPYGQLVYAQPIMVVQQQPAYRQPIVVVQQPFAQPQVSVYGRVEEQKEDYDQDQNQKADPDWEYKSLAFMQIFWGTVWVVTYAIWLNWARQTQDVGFNDGVTANDCCVYRMTGNVQDLKVFTNCADVPKSNYNAYWNVSWEFRSICCNGIWIYSLLIVAGLLNLIRSGRKAANYLAVISVICIAGLLLSASTFRYRDIGKVCSGESGFDNFEPNSTQYLYQWMDMGNFQRRALEAQWLFYIFWFFGMCLCNPRCKAIRKAIKICQQTNES